MTEVQKHGMVVPVSTSLLADSAPIAEAFRTMIEGRQRYDAMTPEQVDEYHRARERRIAQAKADRAAVREATPAAPFSADAVEERLGLGPGMLLHLSQPYCTCSTGYDGIEFCQHATDLGLAS